MKKLFFFLILTMVFVLQSCYYDNKEDLFQYVEQQNCDAAMATFTADIIPVLEAHCNRCHRNDRQDGNVNLEGYNNVKPYVDDGSLYGTTNHESGFSVMPTNGIKIPFCEIELMRIWIADGALNN